MNKFISLIKRNETTILSVIAMLGVIGTGVASGIASKKAEEDINKKKKIVKEELYFDNMKTDVITETPRPTKKEYLKKYWYYYMPAVGIGIISCACIGLSDHLNKKRQAALISACALTAESFREYRETVKTLYGEESDILVKNEIAKKNYTDDIEKPEVDELLFYDEISGRYFNATMEDVKDAEYHFNRNFALRDWAVLNEFYKFLGLEPIEEGEVLGWSTWAEATYGYKWVDFEHEKVVMDDGLECYILRYPFAPHADYMDC